MKIMNGILIITVLSFLPATGNAGWLDNIKSKADNVVGRTVNEATRGTEQVIDQTIDKAVNGPANAKQAASTVSKGKKSKKSTGHPSINETNFPEWVEGTDMKKASSQKILNSKLVDLYGGNTTPWNVAPADSLKVRDTAIKKIRLGMPVNVAESILKDQGFEWVASQGQFAKELVEIGGETREMTPSQRYAIPNGEPHKVLKRFFVKLLGTDADDMLIKELSQDPTLSKLIKDGRALQKKNRSKQPMKLVFRLEYRQSFVHGSKFETPALMAQFKQIFGEANYKWNQGSAFSKGSNWLIYHDGAHIPMTQKEALLSQMPNNYRHAFKSAFIHPCGGKDTRNCPSAAVTGAFPDDINKQLEALKITSAPVMMVEFSAPNITTYLSWEYLNSQSSVREMFAKKKSREAQPVATIDF
jgi:hypothetical protein